MRSRKPSDSPSGACRDVYPLRPHHGLTVPMVQQAQAAKLTELNDQSVRLGGVAVSLMDPRDIAAQVEMLAVTTRRSVLAGGLVAHELADALGAQVLALRLSLARSEADRIDTGDAA